jgi:hypothetical protein
MTLLEIPYGAMVFMILLIGGVVVMIRYVRFER